MEEQKKSRKPLLIGIIAAVLVLAGVLALLLSQCGTWGQDTPTDTTGAVAQSYDLYWNVDRKNFEVFEDESGEAAGTTGRKPAEDGFYHVVFVKEGKQIELRVKERRLVNVIDAYDLMGLVFDENGDVIDIIRLDDMPLEKKAWQYFIQSFGGKAVKFNSSKDLEGMEEMVNINDATKIYDMSGCSEYIGASAKLQKFDRVMVIANELGEITHIFIYEREGIETTKMAFCKHCNEEVEWSNWFKANELPRTSGHYYLDKDITVNSQMAIRDDQKICLDFNGHTVTGTGGGRAYSTFYAGSALAVMDNSEGTPGKIAYIGKNADQGNCLWARYGNIDIYDITVDGSQATTRVGGTAVAVESTSIVHMHSGTLIGGETVTVKGKSSPRTGGTVRVLGQFIMDDGLITGGVADGQGGNVYIGGKGSFTMNGGKITNGRTRNNNGGNVAAAGKTTTFIMNGGTISGGRAIIGEKGTNGAGGNVYATGTFKMNGGTITDGRCYNWNGTRVENDTRQNAFLPNCDFYMYGGTIKGYVSIMDTNLTDDNPAVIYVSGTAKITGAKEGGRNLTLASGVIFRAGTLRKGAEVRVYASGVFSKPTKESNVNFVHSDVPEAQVCYYQECLAIGRFQCLCGAKEGEEHIAAVCDGTKLFFAAYTSGSIRESGNYYLASNKINVGQIGFGSNNTKDENGNTVKADPITVNLDLNGKTLSSKERAMLLWYNATVNISDSTGGGRIEGRGYNNSTDAGTILTFPGSTLNIYKGVTIGVRDDLYENIKFGAAIKSSGTLNMYGGTIQGGHAADQGGSVHLNGAAVLNMYNDALITGGSSGAGHGGNVYAPRGSQVNMYGNSKIVDGTATKQSSGNIYVVGTLTMTDNASISGGKGADKYSRNVFCVNGNLNVMGDAYLETAQVTNSGTVNHATIKVGGGAKIDALSRSKASANDIPVIEIDGTLADTAKIVLIGTSGVFSGETVAENADNFVSDDGEAVSFKEDVKKLAVGGRYQCVCGASKTEGAEHALGCDKVVYFWEPLGDLRRFTTSGNYYLTKDVKITGPMVFKPDENVQATVRIDLSGYSFISTNNTRMLQLWKGTDLTLSNSKPSEGGLIRGNGYKPTETKMESYAIVHMADKDTVLNMLTGVTMEHTGQNKQSVGGVGNVAGVFNMYGGKIIGGLANDGGALMVTGGTFNMHAGQIVGGKANRGGAIIINKSGVANVLGGEIIGGEATQYGGAIFNDGGSTLNIENATLSGGKAPRAGTLITSGTTVIKNSVINGGVAVRDTQNHTAESGCGAAISIGTGSLTIDNSIINSGHVEGLDGSDSNTYGGAAIHAKGGTVTVKNNSVINGYVNENGEVAHSNIRRGGTLYLTGSAKFTLEDSVVTASKVGVNASTLLMEGAGNTFTMKGTAKLDSSNVDNVMYGAVTVAKGTFTMENGQIIGAKATTHATVGAGAVHISGGTFKMMNGTITGGTASKNTQGGNVCVGVGTFEMSGGTITGGNSTLGGGVYVRANTTVKISGDAKITGNTGSNLVLADGAVIEVGTMADGANIGVTMAAGTGIFSSNAVSADVLTAGYFVSDNTTYAVERHDGKLAILTPGTGNGDGAGTGGGEGGGNEGGGEGGGEGQEPATDKLYHCICGMKHATSLTDANPTVKGDCFGACNREIHEWAPWTSEGELPYDEGYFYLTKNVDYANTTQQYGRFSNGDISGTNGNHTATRNIVIDLNGHTVTGTKDRTIVLRTSGDTWVNLTITDTSDGKTGKLLGAANSSGTGALIYMWSETAITEAMTLNIYNATVDASNMTAGYGTALYVGVGNTLNLYRATVLGGKTTNANLGGGAIYVKGNLNMLESTVSALQTEAGVTVGATGAAIHADNGARIIMEGGSIIGGNVSKLGGAVNLKYAEPGVNGIEFTMRKSPSGQLPVIDARGKTSGTNGAAVNIDGYGGNILFTMDDGTIYGGESKSIGGGAVCVQDTGTGGRARFVMNNGTITGGSYTGSATYGGGNIRVTAGGVFEMNGGIITDGYDKNNRGEFHLTSDGKLIVSGSAKINGLTSFSSNKIEITGTLIDDDPATTDVNEGAVIVVKNMTGTLTTATVAENVNNFRSADGYAIVQDATGALEVSTTVEVKHCQCGASVTGAQHALGCTEEILTWTPLEIPSNGTINVSGNYYLTKDISRTAQISFSNSANIDAGNTADLVINLDLNGHNISSTYRAMSIAQNTVLTISNTKLNPNSGVNGVISTDGMSDSFGVFQTVSTKTGYYPTLNILDGVTMQNTATDTAKTTVAGIGNASANCTVNVYGGTFIGGEVAKSGGVFSVAGTNSELNIYGGTFTGAKAPEGGSVIYMEAGTVNIQGGTLIGADLGSEVDGGTIYVKGGDLNIFGNAAVIGGIAKRGGAVYVAGGSLEIYGDAIVTGGSAKHSTGGGTIYVGGGSVDVYGNAVVGKATVNGTEYVPTAYMGAVFYIGANRTVNIYGNAKVYGGTVSNMGSISCGAGNLSAYGDAVLTGGIANGDAAGGAIATRGGASFAPKITLSGNAVLTGGVCTGANANGGNIYMEAGTPAVVTISGNAKVTNGRTANEGGNIYVGTSATLIVKDSAEISGGKKLAEGTESSISTGNVFVVGGTLNVQGGTIDGDAEVAKGSVILSGNAKINKNATSGKGLTLAEAADSNVCLTFGEGGLTAEASVAVNKSKDQKIVARPENTAEADWQAYRKSMDRITSADGLALSFEADGIYLRTGNDGTNPILYHCVCAVDFTPDCDCTPVEGVHTGECATQQVITHLGTCDGYDVPWSAWNVAEKGKMPDVAGKWYIADAATIKASTYIKNDQVFIDLNGKTVTVGGTFHAFIYQYTGTGTSGEITGGLTITDSGKTGAIVIAEGKKANAGILCRNSGGKVTNATLTIYGGRFDASKFDSTTAVGAVDLGKNAVINMYGGTIAGNKEATYGAAVLLDEGSQMTMSGNAQIIGGNATSNSGDGAVRGGGAVMVKFATLTMSGNATISGGTAAKDGDNVKVYGKVSSLIMQDNASITGATNNDVYAVNSTVTMTGGHIGKYHVSKSIADGAKLNIQGKVRIDYFAISGESATATRPVITGALAEDASVSINMGADYKIIDRGTLTDTEWAAYEAYAEKNFTCDSDKVISYEADGIYLRAK